MKTIYKTVIRYSLSVIRVQIMFIVIFFLSPSFCLLPAGAQPTNKISYQAVARNASGDELPNQNISVRLSILNGSGGPSLYTETHSTSTNLFGLFTIQIGGGAVVSGNYNSINWSAGNQWLKVEMDPAGGNSYVNMGESQLLSVPYALHAAGSNQWSSNGSDISNANSGNVGIGTNAPASKLHIYTASDGDGLYMQPVTAGHGLGVLLFNTVDLVATLGAAGGAGSWIPTSVANDVVLKNSRPNSLIFGTNNVERMRINSNGDVGIGTTAPLRPLHVVTSGADIAEFKSTGSSDARILFSTGAGIKGSLGWTPFNNTMTFSSYGADDISFGVNNLTVEAIRIKATTGRVGVGTTSPLSTFNVAHVTGSLTEGIGLTNSSVSSTWYFYSSSSGNMFIGKTGNLGSFDGVTGAYTALSDVRKKTNVNSLSPVLASVMNLDIKRYEYTNNNPGHRKSIGLMAQDVAPYFPELVYNFRDDAEGVDYLSLDYSGFGVIALKAIQEQQKIIEALKAEVELLKAGKTEKK